MKTNSKNSIKCIDIFDDEVSLYNLLGGNGLRLLQKIADTYHMIEERDRPLSIILNGKNSTTLYSICFLRSLAMEISRIPAPLLFPKDRLYEFFTPSDEDSGYIIEDAEHIRPENQTQILEILQKGEFNHYDPCHKDILSYPVLGIIFLTCKDIKQVFPPLTKAVDYVVNIDDLNRCQIIDIIKMRLKWASVGYDNERVIEMLAAGTSLRMIISIIKMAIVMMLAERRSCLTAQDVVKARECL